MPQANPTVVFTAPRKVAIEERDCPTPRTGEVLVQTRRSLVSIGTELTILSGDFPPGSMWAEYAVFPFLPGYCNVGKVVEVGPGVEEGWIGRRVATNTPHSQFVVAPTTPGLDQVRPLHRDEVPDEEAAFFTLVEIAMNGIRRAEIGWGESVVVYGLGVIGQLVVRLLRLVGARPVVAVEMAESRLAMLPSGPGMAAANPERESVPDIVREVTSGRMADVVIELTGNQDVIPAELGCIRNQGRFLVLSSPRGTTQFDFHDLCNARSISIIGAHTGSHAHRGELDLPWTRQRHSELFFDLVADKELDLQPLITHRAPYTDAPKLYQMLLEDRSPALGVILEWPD